MTASDGDSFLYRSINSYSDMLKLMNEQALEELKFYGEPKMKIQTGAYYRTRSGKKAYVIGRDNHEIYPFVGRIDNDQDPTAWTADGSYLDTYENDEDEDLIAPWRDPIKAQGFVNIYPYGHEANDCAPSPGLFIYRTKEDADKHQAEGRIACVYVSGEEK